MADNRSSNSSRRRLLVAVADQMASSGSNFLLVVLLARHSTADELGVLLLGYAVLTMCVVVSRSAFGAIVGMDSVLLDDGSRSLLVSRSLAAALTISVVPLLLMGGFALGLSDRSSFTAALILLGVTAPVVLMQDLMRYVAVADGSPGVALASDALWLGASLLGLVIFTTELASGSPVLGAAFWAGGAVASFLFIWIALRQPLPLWAGTWAWALRDRRRVHLALTAGIGGLSQVTNSSLAGVLVGPHVISAVRGAGTLFGPLNTLTSSVAIAVVPEAKRTTPVRAERIFGLVTLGTVIVTVAWGTALLLLPDTFGFALLGESWPLARALALATTVEYCGLALWAASSARLRSHNRTGLALTIKSWHAGLSALAPPLAAWYYQSALAFAITLAILGIGLGFFSALVSRRKTRNVLSWSRPGGL